MKYYILSHASDQKVIGEYPQTKPTEAPYQNGLFDPDSRSNLENDKFPEIPPKLDLELDKKAKLTDIISASNIQAVGLFINEKVKNILSEFNILNHEFYEGSLSHNGKTDPYFWLHIVNDSLKGIDFENSIFAETDLFGDKVNEVRVDSESDWYIKNKECEDMNFLNADKLVFTANFMDRNYDIFLFPYIHHYIIVSERVIQSLEDFKITGYHIKKADFI
ncbi:MAG: hypothetical protein JKX95_05085 [Bacteroidia bacterium]|nr:hypothetical protein [Bacteroidia bacterium]